MQRTAVAAVFALIVAGLVLHGIAAPAGVPSPPGATNEPGSPGGTGPVTPRIVPPPGTPIPFETVWAGSSISFGTTERQFLVIQTREEWVALWDRIDQNPQPPPRVDFATRTVLVAIFGVANTGGFSISVESVVVALDASIQVLAVTSSPGRGCLVPMVITYPVHMVSIPKMGGPFAYEERHDVYSCD